jgi:phage tail sheath protein FI
VPASIPPGARADDTPAGVPPIAGVATSIAAFVGFAPRGPINRPVEVSGVHEYEQALGPADASTPLGWAVRQFFLNGGRQAIVVRVTAGPVPAGSTAGSTARRAAHRTGGGAAEAAAVRGSRGAKTGLYALEDVDLFNLLCLPGVADAAVLSDAIAYAEERRAFAILDVPPAVATPREVEAWVGASPALRHRNAALYFPRVRGPETGDGPGAGSMPACGAVAGLYARMDTAHGVWKAASGTDAALRDIQAFDYALSESEAKAMNRLGVNGLRALASHGAVAWGARTLEGADPGASEWKYVPVRRTALYIEESLDRGTRWAVFEPNDEPLWADLRLAAGAFMHGLFTQGAFQGRTPRDAYFVKCDAETTTPDDIDRGIVTIRIGFAPLKPAEFVVLTLRQVAGQVAA